jgi:tRNA(fMet)-specific endonuclease VapC
VKPILLDTNAYSELIRGDEVSRLVVNTASKVFLPLIVVAELRAGFKNGSQTERNEIILNAFLTKAQVLLPDLETTQHYAEIHRQLRTRGRQIPTNDLWIAALALQHQMPLLTFDSHFKNVQLIQVIKTVEDFLR